MKRLSLLLPVVSFSFVACGDALLPSDYTGPPAGAVSANVLPGLTGVRRDAGHPRLSLEWLNDSAPQLIAQAASFQRSPKLQHDWDIGLSLPTEAAKFDVQSGTQTARIAVAKMVYFDDSNGTGRIDWSCRDATCNRVLAVSAQYVVFVD